MRFTHITHGRFKTLKLATSALAIAASSLAAEDYSLANIGQFAGASSVQVRGLTHDGKTIAGNWRTGMVTTGYTWTAAGGRTDLANPGATNNSITGISGDGSVVFGRFIPVGQEVPHVQALGGNPQQLPMPAGFFVNSGGSAFDASDDGSVIVGYVQNIARTSVAIWNRTGPMTYAVTEVPDLPGGSEYAIANGVSGDGSIVVGNTDIGDTVAFRWTAGTGIVALGDLTAPGGGFEITSSLADKISQDGTTIVGYGTEGTRQRAMRWTQATGMVALPAMEASEFASHARDVSGDGSVIVGASFTTLGERAFRWTESSGTQNLATLLASKGVDMTGTTLKVATTITPDGRVIAGEADVDFGMGVEPTGFIAIYDETPTPAAPAAATAAATPNSTPATTTPATTTPPAAAGVIFPRDFTDSANSIGNAVRVGGHAARLTSDGLFFQGLNAPTGSGGFGFAQRPTEYGGFVFGQGRRLLSSNPDSGNTGAGGAGVTFKFPNGVFAGVGALALRHDYTAGLRGSTVQIDGRGGGFFVRYAPNRVGMQVMVSGAALALNADVNRNYLNGGATVTASGSTKGRFSDIRARFGWGMDVGGGTTVTPFGLISHSRATFDGYTETGGLFAGSVSQQTSRQTTARIGAEVRRQMTPKLEWNASLSFAQTRETGALASVSVGALGGTQFGGGSANRTFGSSTVEFGVTYAMSDSVTVQSGLSVTKGVNGARDVDEAALSVGISFTF